MDPFEALGDHGPHAEELRPLRGPVARRARAVLLAREDDERDAVRAVALGRLEDRHLLARGDVHRPRSLRARNELVPQPHVRERPTHHHLVVSSARAVRVERLALDAVLDEVDARGRVRLDRARRGDVIGRHGVADRHETPRSRDVLDRGGARGHVLEVRRQPHVRRVGLPREELAVGDRERAPGVVAGVDVRVGRAEHRLADRARDRLLDLLRGRPEVREEDVLAVRADADRLAREVDVHAAGERVRDDERR